MFVLLVSLFTLAGFFYVYQIGGPSNIAKNSLLNEFGKFMGVVGFFSLVVVYGRSVLKIMIARDYFWKKLSASGIDSLKVKNLFGKLLVFLTRTHAYFGTLAISTIFLHCYFTYSLRDNVLLISILFLMLFEGITGIILQFWNSPKIKIKSYLMHSQLFVGFLILFLALFGHALL